jgi:hypothetical protein
MTTRPFDNQLSRQVDAVVVLLESPQPFFIRLFLRYLKRRLERGIPT